MITNEDKWEYLKWARREIDRKKQELSQESWKLDADEWSLKKGATTQDFDNRVVAYKMNKQLIKKP